MFLKMYDLTFEEVINRMDLIKRIGYHFLPYHIEFDEKEDKLYIVVHFYKKI